MFDIFSKSDKKDNLAIDYIGEIGQNGYMNYKMDLPISNIKIRIKTKYEDRLNGNIHTVANAKIKVGKQWIKKDFGDICRIGERRDLDINKIVHSVVAYNYVKQNKPDELEYFLKGIDGVLSFNDNYVDSQKMLDKVFGEGVVDLDGMVEAEVDKRLQRNDAYYDKYASNKLLGKLQDGFAKMVEPLILARDKVKEFFTPENDDYYDRF